MQNFLSLSGRLERLSYASHSTTRSYNLPFERHNRSSEMHCTSARLILNLKKISMPHNSLGPNDVAMQFSSTPRVLFHIMNGHLATGAAAICYDGSPMWLDVHQLIRILAKFKCVLEPIVLRTPVHPN